MLLLFLLAQAGPVVSRPVSFGTLQRPGTAAASRAEIESVCRMSPATSVDSLQAWNHRISDSILWRDNKSPDWTRLACIRAVLSRTDAFPVEGAEMTEGTTWAQGAFNALLKDMELHPRERPAFDLLLMFSIPDRFTQSHSKVDNLVLGALQEGMNTSLTLRACTQLAYLTKDTTLVKRCAHTGLDAGIDSTWHLLYLARLGFDVADTLRGQSLFFAAVEAARDSFSRAEISWHLQWFLSPNEMATWLRTPDSATAHQIRDWVTRRDVRDGRPEGARLAEHFKRLAQVEYEFETVVPKDFGTRAMTITTDCYGMKETRQYERWQNEFDDRGVIWMRFGPPLFRTNAVDSNDCEWEHWEYPILLDTIPLHLTFGEEMFDGNAGAGTLFGNRPKLIQLVTQTDDNAVRTDNPVRVAGQFHRIWDPVTELPLALVSYGLAIKDLKRTDSAGRRLNVNLTVRQWDPGIERWDDTTLTRTLAVPKGAKGDLFAGVLALPTTRGTTAWSLVAKQSPNRWGRTFEENRTPLPGGDLKLSDIILGAPSQGLYWAKGKEHITLAPQGALDHQQEVSLFFQMMTTRRIDGVAMTISVFRTDRPKVDTIPALQITLKERLEAGLSSFSRSLNVSRLGRGDFRMEVTLVASDGSILAKQSREMLLR